MAVKVLQVLPDLSAGGAEGFVANLGVSLAALGAKVRFFLLAGVRGDRGEVLYARLRGAGICVEGTEERDLRSVRNLLRLRSVIGHWSPDIVQANMYQAEVFAGAARIGSRRRGALFVRRLANTRQSFHRTATAERLVRMMERFFDMTIACSPSAEESYRKLLGGAPLGRLITIPNGGLFANTCTTAVERQQARQSLGIPEGAFVVAHVGSMFGDGRKAFAGLDKARKGHDVLIKAFAASFSNVEGCVLALLGDGPLRPAAEMLAKQLGVADKVLFLGQSSEPWPLLKSADVFCFPSRQEGQPNALLEAASCGLPVVASDIPEIRCLAPWNSWVLKPVDDVDAIAGGLLEVRSHLESFVHRARTAAAAVREQYSMQACARAYLDAYESLLERR